MIVHSVRFLLLTNAIVVSPPSFGGCKSHSKIIQEAARACSLATNHSGAAEGLTLTSVRSFSVKRVPPPVTLESGPDQFTPKGSEAAEELATLLRQRAPSSISVVGQTGARGSATQNQWPAQHRAEALAAFLRSHGYHGQPHTKGEGETQPAVLIDPSLYRQEEI